MREAIQIEDGRESLVTAEQTLQLFLERKHSGAQWKCYICGQRVIPAAMGRDYFVAPHFKHERNNDQAQKCELYEAEGGSFSSYATRRHSRSTKVMPMYIQEEQGNPGIFEVGFELHALHTSLAERLVSADAQILVIGKTTYPFSLGSIPFVDTRIPCPNALSPKGSIHLLANSLLRLEDLWGDPEDPSLFLLFVCNKDHSSGTLFGRRMHEGSELELGTTLLIASPPECRDKIKEIFPDATSVGRTRSQKGTRPLVVYKACLDQAGYEITNGYEALERFGFTAPSPPAAPFELDKNDAPRKEPGETATETESDAFDEEIKQLRCGHCSKCFEDDELGFEHVDGKYVLICPNCLEERTHEGDDRYWDMMSEGRLVEYGNWHEL